VYGYKERIGGLLSCTFPSLMREVCDEWPVRRQTDGYLSRRVWLCRYNTRPDHLKVVLGDFDRTVFEDYAQMTAAVEEVTRNTKIIWEEPRRHP